MERPENTIFLTFGLGILGPGTFILRRKSPFSMFQEAP
jgi:hypothetical protein